VLVNEGADNARYSGVTLGQAGPLAGSPATAAGFNGSSSYVQLPTDLVSGTSYQSVSLWFKTTAGNGVLLSYQGDPITNGTTPGNYAPEMYVGADGKLLAKFQQNSGSQVTSSAAVTDGSWHDVVISGAGNTQTVYLDGKAIGSLSGTISLSHDQYDYVGAGFLGGAWPDESHQQQNGNTGYATYFNGSIADVGFWDRPVTSAEVAAMYAAGKARASLVTKVTRPSGSVHAG
jgi:hypothetical protein